MRSSLALGPRAWLMKGSSLIAPSCRRFRSDSCCTGVQVVDIGGLPCERVKDTQEGLGACERVLHESSAAWTCWSLALACAVCQNENNRGAGASCDV